MTDATTIKIPRRLHQRIAEQARREQVTQAQVIEKALDDQARERFWQGLEAFYNPDEVSANQATAEEFSATLADGLT